MVADLRKEFLVSPAQKSIVLSGDIQDMADKMSDKELKALVILNYQVLMDVNRKMEYIVGVAKGMENAMGAMSNNPLLARMLG